MGQELRDLRNSSPRNINFLVLTRSRIPLHNLQLNRVLHECYQLPPRPEKKLFVHSKIFHRLQKYTAKYKTSKSMFRS